MDNLDRRLLLGAAGIAGVAALAGRGKAGPIDPPAGPVGPTAKPLSEVEPRTAVSDVNTPGNGTTRYRITRPGSYYLLDNILNVNGKHGIEIASSDVTLDLCGFELTMLPGSGAFDGVTVLGGALTGISVLNGSVRNWGRNGVDLSSGTASNCRIEGLRSSSSGAVGIIAPSLSIVHACTVSGAGSSGIVAGFYSTISACTASGATFTGIGVNGGGTVTGCTAQGNGTNGISASGTVSNCSAVGNTGTGISVSGPGAATACTASGNATGISGGVGAVIIGCTAIDNSQAGISVNDGGSIIDCTAMDNPACNIRCADNCLVRGCNTWASNSFPSLIGFKATGANNRLERNNASGATTGFDIDGTGNILLGNTAQNNATDYAIAAGNVCQVFAAAVSPAFSGSVGGVSPGTTSAWANLSI
jgi:parallel beta-helix repeat protein